MINKDCNGSFGMEKCPAFFHKKLLAAFIFLVLAKSLFAVLAPAPAFFSDEYIYFKMAQNLAWHGNFAVNSPYMQYASILYSAAISPAFLFGGTSSAYLVAKIINCVISSLIIFPAYFLASEFLKKRGALFAAVLVSILPMSFSFSSVIMSENLFYPLVLSSVYFFYKTITENGKKWPVLAGIFSGLCYLTHTRSVLVFAAFAAIAAILLASGSLGKSHILKLVGAFSITAAISVPLALYNLLMSGGLFGEYSGEFARLVNPLSISAASLLLWILLYLGFIMFSSLLLLNFSFRNLQSNDKKIKLLGIISTVFIFVFILFSAYQASTKGINLQFHSLISGLTGRPMGRYIDIVLPLAVISGYVGYANSAKKGMSVLYSILIAIPALLFSQLIFFRLLPVNNLSLSWLGFAKLAYDKILPNTSILFTSAVFGILAVLFYAFLAKVYAGKTRAKLFLLIFVVLSSLLCSAAISYNSQRWSSSEQMVLSHALENTKSGDLILVDAVVDSENYGTAKLDSGGKIMPDVIGFFAKGNIVLGDIQNLEKADYVVTRDYLDLKFIKETPGGIKLYKNDK